ncbi:MAG: hypothetical protein Q8L47_02525 [bacterium]|nr:hypothetical protein [bacterium]
MIDGKVTFLAEVKTKSPFGYSSSLSFDELFNLVNIHGDIVSIHTDERWGGSFELLQKVRKLTAKPILAKGIHKTDSEINRALSCGANFVLVVGRIPKDISPEFLLIEPKCLAELKTISKDYKVVWNARDLETGKPKIESFVEARNIFQGWLCQASYIKTKKDLVIGADAVLIGENLREFTSSL